MLGRAANNETAPRNALRSATGSKPPSPAAIHQKQTCTSTSLSALGVAKSLEEDKAQCAQDLGSPSQPLACTGPAGDGANKMSEPVHSASSEPEPTRALLLAANEGLLERVQELRRSGAEIEGDISAALASRALRSAASLGRLESVRAWIAAGANIHATNRNGATALMIAAQAGHPKVVEILMKAGARLDVANLQGETALTLAAQAGHSSIVTELRIAHQRIPDHLRHAKVQQLVSAISSGHMQKAVSWIAAGLHLGEVSWKAWAQMAELQFGPGSQGAPLVFSAAGVATCATPHELEKHWQQVHLDINMLQSAGMHIHTLTRNLRQAGARLPDVAKAYAERALREAAREQSIPGVRAWIAAGVDVNAVNENRVTALMYAASSEDVHLITIIMEAGANLNAQDKAGDSALIYAAKWGSVVAVRLLLDGGASIDRPDKSGHTAMYWALRGGRVRIVDLLMQNGAKFCSEQLQEAVSLIVNLIPRLVRAPGSPCSPCAQASAWANSVGLHSLAAHISQLSSAKEEQGATPA